MFAKHLNLMFNSKSVDPSFSIFLLQSVSKEWKKYVKFSHCAVAALLSRVAIMRFSYITQKSSNLCPQYKRSSRNGHICREYWLFKIVNSINCTAQS